MLSDIPDSSATHSYKYIIWSNTGYAIYQGRCEIDKLYSRIRSHRNLFVGLYSMGVKQGEFFLLNFLKRIDRFINVSN